MGCNIHDHSFSKHLNTMCKVLGIRGQGADEQAQIVACGTVTTMANAVCVWGAGRWPIFPSADMFWGPVFESTLSRALDIQRGATGRALPCRISIV